MLKYKLFCHKRVGIKSLEMPRKLSYTGINKKVWNDKTTLEQSLRVIYIVLKHIVLNMNM